MVKNGYPPQYSPEVFHKVMEQVENFEEYSEHKVLSYLDSQLQEVLIAAEEVEKFDKH